MPALIVTTRGGNTREVAGSAGLSVMENLRDNRRSLLKIERRVHSRDYVPVDVFAGLP